MEPKRALWDAIRVALLAVAILAGPVAAASVREPILAGSWYPKNPGELERTIQGFLDGGKSSDPALPAPIALIVPHAGYVYSGATAGKAFAAVRGRAYDRVILMGPSHHVPFEGAALPGDDEDSWRTPLGEIPLDLAALAALANSGTRSVRRIPEAHAPEHSLEIEVPFLQVALKPGFRLVPILIGRLDETTLLEVAAAIRPLMGPATLVVTSSDFTHYGTNYDYVPFGDSVSVRLARMDGEAIAAIERFSAADFESFRERTGSTICGAEPIRVLLTLLRGGRARVEKAGYAQSGALTGDYTNSVSYAAMVFTPPAGPSGGPGKETVVNETGHGHGRSLNVKEQEFLLKLARDTIASKLRGSPPPAARAPDEFGPDSPLRQVQGVFVTLTERGQLRGCIGSIMGIESLVTGVAHQALNSAFEDPRFPPVTARDLADIHVEISVLTPPIPVAGPDDIVVGRHGVFLEKRGYRAVFLPQVATEQGWDRETMLRQLCRKAGLGPDEWKSGASFEVFEAQIFEERGPQ